MASAYERAMAAEKARLAQARERNSELMREQVERETGMSAELDRAFELAFEAGRDRSAQGRLEGGGAQERKRKRPEADDPAKCAVYVRGLPLDATWSRVQQHFSKAGDVKRVKLYKDGGGRPKGDALVVFGKERHARSAVEQLHGSDLFGYVLDVSAADFSASAAAAAAERTDADAIAQAVGQRALDPEVARCVVLSNVYAVEEAAASAHPPTFFAELEDDMWRGCAELGEVERAKALPGDPDCCVCVRFTRARDAAECVRLMGGRFFNGRQLRAAHWDGNLRRKLPAGVDAERQARLGAGGADAAAAAVAAPPPPPPPPAAEAAAAGSAAPAGAPAASAAAGAGEAAHAPPLPPRDELARLSVKELRRLLAERAIGYAGCVEKSDLVDRLLGAGGAP